MSRHDSEFFDELAHKTSLYTYVGRIETHPGPRHGHGNSLTCFDVELRRGGLVYPRSEPDEPKSWISLQGQWYALIEKWGMKHAWLVKPQKLYDIRKVEALRWRIYKRLARANKESSVLWDRAQDLGEIRSRRLAGDGYVTHRLKNGAWHNVETGKHDDAITLLAEVTSPEVDELSAEIEVADNYVVACRRAAHMIDETLALALELQVGKPPLHTFMQQRYTINGRTYFMTVTDLSTGCTQTQRVWPRPDDVHESFQ